MNYFINDISREYESGLINILADVYVLFILDIS